MLARVLSIVCVRLRIKVARVLVLPYRALIKFVDWLPLMVLKPKMTAVELFRYLLGACGRIIAQGYRSEKIYLCHGYNFFVVDWYLLRVEMNLGHPHKTRFWYLLGVFSKFSDKHTRHLCRRVPPPPPRGLSARAFLVTLLQTTNCCLRLTVSRYPSAGGRSRLPC